MGKVVVCSTGNGHWSFPGQHPARDQRRRRLPRPDGTWRASDYASGFISKVYPGRQAPDVCGVVGDAPTGALMLLPTSPAA